MKKSFSLSTLATLTLALSLIAGSVSAQVRKTWDFTKGVGAETFANLQADAANWSVTVNADGTFNDAKDLTKMYGELKANGVVIEELRGLTFGSSGLSAKDNYIIAKNKIRVTRNGQQIILPKLAAGQKVTLRARSANSTATDRGFVAGSEFMEYISGPENGICLGGKAEGAAADEDGNYTLVWQIKEGFEGDSTDVVIKTSPKGGLDIALIQIDNGDAAFDDNAKIAYVYGGADASADAVYTTLQGIEGVTVDLLDVKTTDVTPEKLKEYVLTVISSTVPTATCSSPLQNAISWTPILNLNPQLYADWGYGNAVPTATTFGYTSRAKDNLFKDVMIINEDEGVTSMGAFYISDETPFTGVALSNLFANDVIYAYAYNNETAGADSSIVAIHGHNMNHNAYMYMPDPSEGLASGNADVITLFNNVVNAVAASKAEITQAKAPTFSYEYEEGRTWVTLSSANGGAIHYTIDGSDPTTTSTLYSEPILCTQPTTIKAIAEAEGYLVSDVAEAQVVIKELKKAPEIQLLKEEGKTTVTLVSANEGEVMYYNFRGSNDTVFSSKYAEPIVLTKRCDITAFTAAEGDVLQSEAVTAHVDVDNEAVRLDIVSHMDANKEQWSVNGANPTYHFEKKGYPFYSDQPIGEPVIITDEEGNKIDEKYEYAPANNLQKFTVGDWELQTYGQPTIWQSLTVGHNVNDYNGYNPVKAEDDIYQEVTNNSVGFLAPAQTNGNGDKDPASASMVSTVPFQGPFDLVVYLSGYQAKVTAYYNTSLDNADGWVEMGELVGGTEKVLIGTKDASSRVWRANLLPYNGTDPVYVKLVSGGNDAKFFDIYIKNCGEISQGVISGIQDVKAQRAQAGNVVRTIYYNTNGAVLGNAAKGINIVKQIYDNGTVKVSKVAVQ